MRGGPRIEARRVLLLAAVCLFMLVAFRPGSMGLRLAVNRDGVSFLFKAASVDIAFDIGQACSESNSCGGLLR